MVAVITKTVQERMEALSIPVTECGCIVWLGSTNRKGYGLVHYHGKTQIASRVVWRTERGPIPRGLMVCHTCDIPACINVGHMFLGTSKDNVADSMRKGRWIARRGNPVSAALAAAILASSGGDREVALKLNTSRGTVWRVRRDQRKAAQS